jgi:hypothetical protein
VDGTTSFSAWLTLVPDHLIPVRFGGESCTENLVAACARCNNFKGDCDPSGGTRKKPQDEAERLRFVDDAWKVISARQTRREAELDFNTMKKQIAERKPKQSN